MSQQEQVRPVALVTGVSSGIGRAIATMLAENGFSVFGTLRSSQQQPPPAVEPLILDVRDEASVRAAVDELAARTGRIDAVVNNAGSSLVGAVEETDLAQAQALFDVNFFGAVRVTRAVLPHMRARGAGRIVFISSVLGFLPAPFMAFYSASKHALEGYAESLDHEVRTLGIRAALVEPGFIRTNLGKNTTRAASTIGVYAEMRGRAGATVKVQFQAGGEPQAVATVVLRAITDQAPGLRYPVGMRSAMLAMLRRLVPARAFDRSLRKQFHLDG
jgi:NAD(P)-dependent dehydrogenase (short-subunit alcohol dehydrogenase family)